MTDADQLIEAARELEGGRAVLSGGGMVANEYYLVNVEEVRDNGRVKVTGDGLPSGRDEFYPVLGSWRLGVVPSEFDGLDTGKYLVAGGAIRDASEVGMFGTVYDAPVVKGLDDRDEAAEAGAW